MSTNPFTKKPGEPIVSAQVLEVIDQRSAQYGEPIQCFTALGLIWTAFLQQTLDVTFPRPLTAHDAALMMSLVKILRAGRGFNGDNYVDGAAFLEFARKSQTKIP